MLTWATKHPVLTWLLVWSTFLTAGVALIPRFGAPKLGIGFLLIASMMTSFLTAIGEQKANACLVVAALLAPFGFAAAVVFGPSDAGMAALATWALMTTVTLMQGAKQHRNREGHRLLKAGLWSLGAMPLIALCAALTRHH